MPNSALNAFLLFASFTAIACNNSPPLVTTNLPMLTDIKQAQDELVRLVAQSIPEAWERIVINFEMSNVGQEDMDHNMIGFYIVKDKTGGFAEKDDLKLTGDLVTAFTKLNRASLATNKQYWSTCDLVLDSNGKYEMKFSFDPPKRINGILDEQSYYRFSKYLDEYAASRK
jgi:hypothetical protein